MTYLVTARKWRPMIFDDVVGQSHVTNTLRNAITQNRLAHAYLFSGPRGVGKTTTARLLAKVINCTHPVEGNPCNECEFCVETTDGRNMDVIEIDGASNNSVDQIRDLRESARYTPAKGKYKIYVIDEVHMLSAGAFNALLKTLEEPPPHVIFIFATTVPQKVPATILSRCQRFDFRRNSIDEITSRLRFIATQESITIDNDALLLIAKKGDGSMRDSQSIFDQVVAFCGTTVTGADVLQALNVVDQEFFFRVTDIVRSKDTKASLSLVEDIMARGYDIKEFLVGLTEHLRNFLVVRATGSTTLIPVSEPHKKRYQDDAKDFSENDLLRLLKIVSATENEIRWSTQPRVRLEVGLMQLVKMDSSLQINELLEKIEELKKKIETQGIKVVGTVAASMPSKAQPVSVLSSSIPPYRGERSVSRTPVIPVPQQEKPVFSEPVKSYTQQLVSIQEVKSRWEEFVGEVSRQRISLGSVLSHVEPSESGQGFVKVNCFDAYHLDSIRRNREFLTDMTQKIYGAKLRLDAMIGLSDHETDSSTTIVQKEVEDHPVISALKRQLGAEPLK
jgi:DNA polymerase III subunit gamma/tau